MSIKSDAEELLSHIYGLYDAGAPFELIYEVLEWDLGRIDRAIKYLEDKAYVRWGVDEDCPDDKELQPTTKGIDFIENNLSSQKSIEKISSHKIKIGPYEYKWESKKKQNSKLE